MSQKLLRPRAGVAEISSDGEELSVTESPPAHPLVTAKIDRRSDIVEPVRIEIIALKRTELEGVVDKCDDAVHGDHNEHACNAPEHVISSLFMLRIAFEAH